MTGTPYRAGAPLAGGLPLPRVRLRGWSRVIALTGLLALVLPLTALSTVGPLGVVVRDGGAGMLLVGALALALAPALTAAGLLALRGGRIAAGPLLALALGPLLLSVPLTLGGASRIVAVLGTLAPEQAPRLGAQGFGELELVVLLGSAAAAAACLVIAAAGSGAIATLDRARLGGRPGPVVLAAAAAVLWFAGSFAVRVAFRPSFPAASLLGVSMAAPVALGAVAAAAAWTAPSLRGWHDPEEARSMIGHLLAGALGALLAVALLDRASLAGVQAHAFGALASFDLPVSERLAALDVLTQARRAHAWALGVDLVGASLTFAVPVLAALRGRSPRPLAAPGLAVGLLASLSAAGGAAGTDLALRARRAELARALPVVREVALPRVDALAARPARPGGARFVLRGEALEPLTEPPATFAALGRIEVLADRDARFEALSRAASWSPVLGRGTLSEPILLSLVAEPRGVPDPTALGGDGLFLRPVEVAYDVLLAREAAACDPGVLIVELDPPPWARVRGGRRDLPVEWTVAAAPARRAALRAASPGARAVRVVPRPEDDLERIVGVVAALEEDLRSRELGALDPARIELAAPAVTACAAAAPEARTRRASPSPLGRRSRP